MKWMLSTELPEFPFQLTHQDKVLMLGSCFSENIAQKMQQSGFYVMSNPDGILFNPISIAKSLRCIVSTVNSIPIYPVKRDGFWCSLHQHSSIYGESEAELISKVHAAYQKAVPFYKDSSTIIITFGTAHVYVHQQSQELVANCQKLPSIHFQKKLLRIEEIVQHWSTLIAAMQDKKIIFTASPVRHSKDGLRENNLSKSTLLLAIHELMKMFPEQCFYFPSYEIVIDELRDYRFYKEDLVHPNEQAIGYVWEKWSKLMYDEETKAKSKTFNALLKRIEHRPLLFTEEEISSHKQHLLQMVENLAINHKELNVSYLNSVLGHNF